MSRARRLHGLKACIAELRILYDEAALILTDILVNPSAAAVRELCGLFRVLQAYFAIRFCEAQELALAVLGSIGPRSNI